MDALVSFFINLDSYPAHSHNHTPEGKALVWHQAHAREDWHRKLADFKKKAKDLSIHNNVTQAHWHALHLYSPRTAFTSPLRYSTRAAPSHIVVHHTRHFPAPTRTTCCTLHTPP
jgi:hypothetical protein